MRAVIFAAGKGGRLVQSPTSAIPKILLEVGGVTLLEWHYRRLLAVGLDIATVVVGYQAELVREMIEELNGRYSCQVDAVVNADFVMGSVVSMNASFEHIQVNNESILLMDGDVLYPSAMLRRLIESPCASCLLVDRSVDVEDPEPVLVPLRRSRPFDFVKGWSGTADCVGESIGFFKVSPSDRERLASRAATLAREHPEEPYEEAIRFLVKRGRFGCEDVTEVPWIEIDFASDLKMAREQVMPAVLSYESNSQKGGVNGANHDIRNVGIGHEIH